MKADLSHNRVLTEHYKVISQIAAILICTDNLLIVQHWAEYYSYSCIKEVLLLFLKTICGLPRLIMVTTVKLE